MRCKSHAFRSGSPEHFDLPVHQKPTVYACIDPSSMRFVPLYHNTKSCEKIGIRMDDLPVNCERRRSLAQCCTNDNSMRFIPLYAAGSNTSPPRMSVSCGGFATSSPFPSVSRSSQSKFFQSTKLLVVNSSDSGILIDSPSFGDSSFGTPEKPSSCVSSEPGKRISVLKRGQSTGLDALDTSIRRDAEEISRGLCSMFERLTIPEENEDSSSEDEGPVFYSHKRGGRRPRVSTRSRVFCKSFSKFPATSRTSKTEGKISASVVSSPGTQLWDDNNNETAEDSSSTISTPRRASKTHQSHLPKKSALEKWCTFCKSNNETEDFMRSHALKSWEPNSKLFKLTCPVLRNYVCPRCGATGDAAHTFTYCPETIREVGYRPKSLITKFKCTPHDSSGRKRMHIALHPGVRLSH